MLFVGAMSLLPGTARAEAPHADAARPDSRPVQVGIGKISPQIPDFSDTKKTMTFSGVVQNTGTTPLKDAHLEVWRSLVTARSAMGSADGEGYPTAAKSVKITQLAAGASQQWSITSSETDLLGDYSPQPGVYAIDFDVRDSNDNFVGGQRTYIVWKPTKMPNAGQARVALMWPVVGQPGLTGQKMPDTSEAPIVADQSTAQQYAQNGRLSNILQQGQGMTVNWLVDPDVLYTAHELANGYFYPDPSKSGKLTGDTGAAPEAWYNQAVALLSSPSAQNCWNLLYGDPDLNTLSHSGPAGQSLLNAAATVRAPVTAIGCRPGSQTVAWPSDGQADAATLAGLAAAKIPNLVTLVGSNLVSQWPSAHASLPSSPNTVVYDNYLSNIFTDPAKPAAPSLSNAGVLAGQQWLAQTALADVEGSGIHVVTPPRDFDPPPELLTAINAVKSVPPQYQWFGLENLGKVLTDAPAKPEKVSALTKVATANMAAAAVNAAFDSQQLDHSLHAIMVGREYDSAVPFRPVATWWRNHGGDAAYGQTVYSTVVADHALVSFGQQNPPLTMSGKSGTVPVTINNKTDATIQVYLRIQDQGAHTMFLQVNQDQGVHSVQSGQSATIRIPVQARGNGQQVTLTAQLYTCADTHDDCTYYPSNLITHVANGSVTSVTVKVSRIGLIALGLMIGSGALLILLIGLRVYRAKRTHHAPAQDTMAS